MTDTAGHAGDATGAAVAGAGAAIGGALMGAEEEAEEALATDTAMTRDAAIDNYQTAMGLAERLAVRRFRAEPLWGLTRAYGRAGDLPAARRAAGSVSPRPASPWGGPPGASLLWHLPRVLVVGVWGRARRRG